jgi:hypothetical protein
MKAIVEILDRKESSVGGQAAFEADMKFVNDGRHCQKEALILTSEGNIFRCACGIYHVQVKSQDYYLDERQFNVVSRLFKLASGILAGRRPYSEALFTDLGTVIETAFPRRF